GFVLYRTKLTESVKRPLQLQDVRDRAQIFANGKPLGVLERRLNQWTLPVELASGTTLDILVENMGRINYGHQMVEELKGITKSVSVGARELTGWEMYLLPMSDISKLRFSQTRPVAPAFLRARVSLDHVGDTFLDMRGWVK